VAPDVRPDGVLGEEGGGAGGAEGADPGSHRVGKKHRVRLEGGAVRGPEVVFETGVVEEEAGGGGAGEAAEGAAGVPGGEVPVPFLRGSQGAAGGRGAQRALGQAELQVGRHLTPHLISAIRPTLQYAPLDLCNKGTRENAASAEHLKHILKNPIYKVHFILTTGLV
jgi:hypothetical protein